MYRSRALDYVKSWEESEKRSNSTYSCDKIWLSKCFDHFFDVFNDVDKTTKEKLISLLDSIKNKYSDIEKTIEKYEKL